MSEAPRQNRKRRVSLRIGGPLAEDGRVPLGLLARKLDAVQRVLFNIGSSLHGGGSRGQWKADVVGACELGFVEARFGSLEVVAELPPVRTLPGLDVDLGADALDRLEGTLEAIHHRDRMALSHLYQDFGQRARVLKSLAPLLPEEGADYDLSISVDDAGVALRPEHRPFVSLAARLDQELPEGLLRSLTGLLFRVEVSTGARQIGLIVDNRKIRCFYPPDLEDAVKELIPGSLVEVEGRATLDAQDQVDRIEEVLDVRTVQLIPLFWRRVSYGDRVFRLRRAIEIKVDFHEGLWVHEFEPLFLLAYAPTRSESLDALRQHFAAAWDEIALEDDAHLTADARDLKQRLLDVVERVDPLA
jgi:hypothetical protein